MNPSNTPDAVQKAIDKAADIVGAAKPRTVADPEPETGPKYERPASILGMVSIRELRHVTGLRSDEVAARMAVPHDYVQGLESLEVELLEVHDLVRYVQALNMQLTILVDLTPRSPLSILSTKR